MSRVAGSRLRYLDWLRGMAVLAMLQAHTFDAWASLSERSSPVFANGRVIGGFAAPLFLWLAGIGAVLSAESELRRTGNTRSAAEVVCRRGLEIFILAFLFRLQAFVVSPGGPLIRLFRVDILNVMGPALVLVGLLWGVSRRFMAVTAVMAIAAMVLALVTPLVRGSAGVDLLPIWFQWYLRPAGEHTMFTLLPWSGFVLAGAAAGSLISQARSGQASASLYGGAAVAGAVMVALGFQATTFAARIAVMAAALSIFFLIDRGGRAVGMLAPLERLGRRSLFVYWIHMELVYGYVSRFIQRQLTIPQTVMAYIAFCLAMYGAVRLRDYLVHVWEIRQQRSASPTPASAG